MTERIITTKDVEYVAKLARLAVSTEEVETMQSQLERILEHVGRLKNKDTENVPPTAHPLDVSNVWRDDVARPFPNISELMKNAPESEEGFFKVKKVIE